MYSCLTVDSWMREAQEASIALEDLETKIKNNYSHQRHQHQKVMEIGLSKLGEVGIKLDRLEALLRNPPSKPILTEEDLEYRWKMLSDIQLRTRAVALSLYALPSPNRPGGSAVPITKETNTNSNSHYEDQMKSLISKDDPELLKPLVPDDPTSSQVQAKQFTHDIWRRFLWKAGQAICIILGAAVVLFILVVLCSVI